MDKIDQLKELLMLARFWYAVLACYMAVLLFLSLNPWLLPTSTESVFSPDKLDHALAYGGLVVILYFCFVSSRQQFANRVASAWVWSLSLAMLTGILIEIAQSQFTRNRTGSVEDAVANAVGALIGFGVYQLVKKIFNR